MQTMWNRAALNPLVCKILVGTVAAGFLAVVIFHQPWFRVEISRADTGVLVAESEAASSTSQWNVPEPSENSVPKNASLAIPLVQSPRKEPRKDSRPSPLRQTAEVSFSKPETQTLFVSPVPTYAEHVAPVLEKHCLRCHDGGVLDFTNEERVIAAARKIAKATASGQMPPWNAKPGFGRFQNAPRLSDSEISLIQNWAKVGAARGNGGEIVAEPRNQWKLGKPAVAYQLPQPFEVPASETGLQWNFVIPTGVKRELYLTGLELRPGNRALVRRMVLSYDVNGTARKRDQQTPQAGFPSSEDITASPTVKLGEWTPGMPAGPLPKESGYCIPAGADLVLTVDYAATSVPALDPWSMGLHLSRSTPKHRLGRIELHTTSIPSTAFNRDQQAGIASYTLPTDVIFYSITPELMHKDSGIRALAETPNGQVIPLVEIENWDPRWKNRYIFAQPLELPKGSRLIVETRDSAVVNLQNPAAGHCEFEVSTPVPSHVEPLLEHNASAQRDF